MPETNPFPTDEELHEMLMEQLLRGIHVAMPGRIQSYDPVHQVADIVIGVKDSYPDPEGDGEYLHVNYPVLPAVPILWPRMGRWFMAMSVEPGDAVQVLFNSSAIGIWRRSPVVDNVEGIDRAMRGVHLVGDVARHKTRHLRQAVEVVAPFGIDRSRIIQVVLIQLFDERRITAEVHRAIEQLVHRSHRHPL